jgi:hypothetical protein
VRPQWPAEGTVKRTFTIALEDEQTPPWLVSAFIVLFGITLAAALPAIAAANAAPSAVGGNQAAPERILVRAKVTIFRALQPKAPGGHDLAQVSLPPLPIAFAVERTTARLVDRGAAIAQRGIRSRAPPARLA